MTTREILASQICVGKVKCLLTRDVGSNALFSRGIWAEQCSLNDELIQNRSARRNLKETQTPTASEIVKILSREENRAEEAKMNDLLLGSVTTTLASGASLASNSPPKTKDCQLIINHKQRYKGTARFS